MSHQTKALTKLTEADATLRRLERELSRTFNRYQKALQARNRAERAAEQAFCERAVIASDAPSVAVQS